MAEVLVLDRKAERIPQISRIIKTSFFSLFENFFMILPISSTRPHKKNAFPSTNMAANNTIFVFANWAKAADGFRIPEIIKARQHISALPAGGIISVSNKMAVTTIIIIVKIAEFINGTPFLSDVFYTAALYTADFVQQLLEPSAT